MLLEELQSIFPKHWSAMDIFNSRFEILDIPCYTPEYQDVEFKVAGNYYYEIQGIFKIQNPLLYAKYNLKKFEYESRGNCNVMTLFHDTCQSNVLSIAEYNFDWRLGERFKYGPGVYFSSSPTLANKHSSKYNGAFRSMFVVNVLVQNVQLADHEIFLPDPGYDTVRSVNGATYVKYFDSEYYPQYLVNYASL